MTHGKGRDFKKLPPLTTEIIKDGHLELLLLEAERAWAYSQDLFAQALKPANEDRASTLRHSATGRFRRAVHWATQLLSHCQALHAAGRLRATYLLQATVYTLTLNGRFLRSRDDEFEDALAQLAVARGILDVLAEKAATSREQALYVLFADEVGPEIRYCAHEMGREKAYDVDGIVKEVSARWREELVQGYLGLLEELEKGGGTGEERKQLKELNWEGKPVPVRNPELVDVLLKVQEAEGRVAGDKKDVRSKKGVAAYDAILLALSDAEEVARKLVEAQQSSGSTSSGATGGSRDIQFVHAYIVYQLLSRRIQRDLLLVSVLLSTSKAGPIQSNPHAKGYKAKAEPVDARLYPAVVKLLDTVLQSLDQMRTLSIVDDSPDLASAVEARTSFIKARRCLFLARCYVPVDKYAEALTLIQHANIHIRETLSLLSLTSTDPITMGTPPYFPLTVEDTKTLEAELTTDSLLLKREWFTLNGGATDPNSEKAKKHEKPLFFNIALNYVELDMDRLLARAGKLPEPSQLTVSQEPVKQAVVEKEKKPSVKAKVEEIKVPLPEPPTSSRGGLSSLLGGWWGRS
ncbi:hypothetical protein H0H81_004292 [Sphagnurus paluster]|uniref:Signal recognition particle subunit SRP68 n=1 Tax=Sphagnurus paluster TaxID=117069 RepID=A0A9P7GQC9_9AGAR|nr:hypothetical protein H0H81_004292 [Sphagnurus paluster]